VSVHLSNSTHLAWHERNFAYKTMGFSELVARAFTSPSTSSSSLPDAAATTGACYLRSLSASPKKPARLEDDFPELAGDFVLPSPLEEEIGSHFFSSPLRVSSADMGYAVTNASFF
jgi:tRNA wybutosine-synthesizing protein 4